MELVRQAREQGLALTGPDGLLRQFTKTVLETALDLESRVQPCMMMEYSPCRLVLQGGIVMVFVLDDVVPWGRRYSEYRDMFHLPRDHNR